MNISKKSILEALTPEESATLDSFLASNDREAVALNAVFNRQNKLYFDPFFLKKTFAPILIEKSVFSPERVKEIEAQVLAHRV